MSSRVFRALDRIPVEAHLQVGVLESPEQAETLDRRPVLPEVRQVQERSLGVRRRDTGAYLPKPAWTEIARHTLVKGGASPDDPALAGYWAQRRRKAKPPLDNYTVRLLSRQDGRCSLCGENLITPDQPPQTPKGWERWFLRVTRKARRRTT